MSHIKRAREVFDVELALRYRVLWQGNALAVDPERWGDPAMCSEGS